MMRKTLLLLKNPWQFLSLSLTLHNPRVSQVHRNAVPSGASEVHSTAISLATSQVVDFLVEEFQFACNCPKSMNSGARGFLFPIVWCSQTGDHPHEDLAQFGYGPGMKVRKK
jgi:hypothetical protein